VDDVFKALGDPHRRLLLDRLFERDGRTLNDLAGQLEKMTRFGVMKHLRVLEEAGLVATRKVGREKLHYLNPVPIRLIHERWVSKFSERWVSGLVRLKAELERTPGEEDEMEAKTLVAPKHVQAIYIKTTPERLWQALTSPDLTQRYYFNGRVDSEWRPGSRYEFRHSNDHSLQIEGEVLEAEPPKRLVMTFKAVWDDDVKKDAPSRVTMEIEPMGETCRLSLVHEDFDGETATYRQVSGGWPLITSSLKSLLETGEPLRVSA
jgi:uncharacterized protein YndB with AHSA1/START domain